MFPGELISTFLVVSRYSWSLSSKSNPKRKVTFALTTSTSIGTNPFWRNGNRIEIVPIDFCTSRPNLYWLKFAFSLNLHPTNLPYALAWCSPMTVRCAPVSMKAPRQSFLLSFKSVLTWERRRRELNTECIFELLEGCLRRQFLRTSWVILDLRRILCRDRFFWEQSRSKGHLVSTSN